MFFIVESLKCKLINEVEKKKKKKNFWFLFLSLLETVDDDEGDRKDENDDSADEKSNLRISQPKYSQLLKGLDFSQARMVNPKTLILLFNTSFVSYIIQVDVTNLLSNELDQQENPSISEENENQKRTTDDEKYQSLSSAASGEDASDHRTFKTQGTDDSQTKEDDNSIDAVNDIQNDLNILASIIQQATDKNKEEEEDNGHSKNTLQKKNTFDEEDDTSKQATQDYDLHENEQEVRNSFFSNIYSRNI